MNILNTISTGIDMADMAWEAKCREEDLIQVLFFVVNYKG
jgi:hypothetical protein